MTVLLAEIHQNKSLFLTYMNLRDSSLGHYVNAESGKSLEIQPQCIIEQGVLRQ